jgi:hypothetical protein
MFLPGPCLSSKDEVQTVQLACPEFIEGFNRYAPFKTFKLGGRDRFQISCAIAQLRKPQKWTRRLDR